MTNLKGLILSGGRGTRLRPLTHTRAKQLVPVANKPVLFYGIEALADAGVSDIGVIVAPETADEIRETVGTGDRWGVNIVYIPQAEPLGLAHAVITAEEFLDGSPFVMYLGDNLLKEGIEDLVAEFNASKPDALILLTPVPDPENYGVAELDGERIVRLLEKPQKPPSNLALVGVYLFTPAIVEAAHAIVPSPRGELEITDAIQHLISSGKNVVSHTVRGWWKDTGQLDDLLEANRLILEDIETDLRGDLDGCEIHGRVIVEPGAKLERSTVRGPAIIAAGSRITASYIGPYTAIDRNVTIERAEVEHSIVLANARIEDLDARMESSLVGRNVTIRRNSALPRAYRFMIGDNSEVSLL